MFTGNAIVNSISVIPWQSVLLVEETGIQRNSLTNLSHKSFSEYTKPSMGFKLAT